jgi:hypothetical protein
MAPVYDTNNSENANLSFYIAKDLNDDTKPYGDSRY